jgi:hypothetical protein
MKIKEQEQQPRRTGFGWGLFTRVRELAENEAAPEGSQPVPDDTPISEWQLTEEGTS